MYHIIRFWQLTKSIAQKRSSLDTGLTHLDYVMILFFTKIAEFAIILELNGYSDCLKIG